MSNPSPPNNGNCPACELDGVTIEQSRQQAPRYMAACEADATSDEVPPVPDQPAEWCWTCRMLLADGLDPHALVFGERYPYALSPGAQAELGRLQVALGLPGAPSQ